MTYAELFYFFYHARRALQALAAFTGDDAPCEWAADLDALADLAWREVRK